MNVRRGALTESYRIFNTHRTDTHTSSFQLFICTVESLTHSSRSHTHAVRWAVDLGGPAAKLGSLIDAWIPAGDPQSSSTFFSSTLSFLTVFLRCVFVGEVAERTMENRFPLHSRRRDLRSGKGGRCKSFKLLVDLVQKWEWNGEDCSLQWVGQPLSLSRSLFQFLSNFFFTIQCTLLQWLVSR